MKTITIKNLPDEFNAEDIVITQEDDVVVVDPPPTSDEVLVMNSLLPSIPVKNDIGWSVYANNSIIWNGPNLFRAPGLNVLKYDEFNVVTHGIYRVLVNGLTTGTDIATDNNDTWFRIINGPAPYNEFQKIFQSAGGSRWQYCRAELKDGKYHIDVELKPGPVTIELSPRSHGHAIGKIELKLQKAIDEKPPVPENPNIGPNDVFLIFEDAARDKDCFWNQPALKMIVNHFGIEHQTHVFIGTGPYDSPYYRPQIEALANMTWAGWASVNKQPSASVFQAVTLIVNALGKNGKIWILEGGPSDFTAEVLAMVDAKIRASISVVQHASANERLTRPDNLKYVREQTNYIRLDSGNGGGNTPDFKQSNRAAFEQLASDPDTGPIWEEAAELYGSESALDFSDAVLLLYALGITSDQIKNIDDYVDYFASAKAGK